MAEMGGEACGKMAGMSTISLTMMPVREKVLPHRILRSKLLRYLVGYASIGIYVAMRGNEDSMRPP